MSSDIDICNLALAHLGDNASVASIDPPEGSAQAEHCARFYPIARDSLIEMHSWNFCTRRIALTLLTATNDQWLYVYAVPNMMANAIAVIPPTADDDYNIPAPSSYDNNYYGADIIPNSGTYSQQAYAIETLSTGAKVICTNQEDAVLRYTQYITDTTKFPSAFVLSLSWLLASMLAGPVIKGDVGAAEGKRCYQMFLTHFAAVVTADAAQRRSAPTHVVPWLAGR
jgi:hypothetical protein